MTAHPKQLLSLFAALLLGALTPACSCGPSHHPDGGTGGEGGGGVDAGGGAGGGVGGGGGEMDAGQDAGPPPMLTLTQVLPPRGATAGGTVVTLLGSAFIRDFAHSGSEARATTTLKFGSNPVQDFQIIDDGTIELRTPPGAAGAANISFQNPNGLFLCNGCFTYYDELSVTSVTPKEGPLAGGNTVDLLGTGFTADAQVLFGSNSALAITLVDSTHLTAVVPRGPLADLVDVTVYNKNGSGNLRRYYRYDEDLRLTSLTPLTGPVAGGTTVTLDGQGFTGVTDVAFGANPATAVTVVSDTQLTCVTPAAVGPGAVDVTLTSPTDSWKAKGAFTYFDPAGAFTVFAVYPHVARPGDAVTLTGQGLDAAGLAVTLGGQAAAVGAQSFSTAVLTVPARGAAPRRCDVAATDGAANGTLAQGFTWGLTLQAIAPAGGPAAGGTATTVTGTALPADVEVFFGAGLGTTTQVTGETQADVTTPAGSGGAASDLFAREAADHENAFVLPAAFTFQEPLTVGHVDPNRGAVAGNTLVTVQGSGFRDGMTVSFGTNKAKDVKVVDSHTLTCRTPKGDVGVVDVSVDRLTEHDVLQGGFSYYDPRSISGGMSGGPLVGTLNVTVLDSTPGFYGAPVPLATVMLGVDPATPFQGNTDDRGQVTFSDPSLVKAQTVTVFKTDYESATVTGVNTENVTVFIARTGGGSGSPGNGPPPPPPSVISGHVTGFKAPRALTSSESLEARVFVAQTSLFGGPPFSGVPGHNGQKWQVVVDGGEYLLYSGAGLRATYAIFGIANKQTGSFEPYLMGIKRGITTSPDNPATDQDIILDTHLDLTVPITIDSPLTFTGTTGQQEPGTNSVYAWLDLGAEGFIPNPNNWATGTSGSSSISSQAAMMQFPDFPQLDGSNFVFLNMSNGSTPYPASFYFRRQPGDMSQGVTIGPMLGAPNILEPGASWTGTVSWTLGSGATPDIHEVQILLPTLFGAVTLWDMVLPGDQTSVTLPPNAVQKLHDEQQGQMLFVVIYSSRSPKFDYSQWTYDSLSGATWSAFTLAESASFSP